MEKRTSNNWTYIFFRMSTLIFTFVVVLYAMRYVNSSEFTSGVNTLFGLATEKSIVLTQQSFWCPDDVTSLEVEGAQAKIVDPMLLKELCKFEIQSLDKKKIEQGVFTKLVKAISKSGEVKTLEYDSERNLFKQDGLKFQSLDLSNKIKENMKLE